MDGFFAFLGFILVVLGIFYFLILPIIIFTDKGRISTLEKQLASLGQQLADAMAALRAGQAGAPLGDSLESSFHSPILQQDGATQSATAQAEELIVATAPTSSLSMTSASVQPLVPDISELVLQVKGVSTSPSVAESVTAQSTIDLPEQVTKTAGPIPTQELSFPSMHDNGNPLSGLFSWMFHGNPLAKLGVLLMFFGLAYLMKFTIDRGLFPIELRLVCASVLCLALLGVGWRLRKKKSLYGLILQGGGIGGLYITVFGAFRLYSLLPHELAFGLMIVICAASVALAVLQSAQSLAVIASLGGYLAPVLLSTGSANHVGLFSYYGLLSAGILGVSIWRSWRPLNLIGFVFTFGVGLMWGIDHYRPEFYASCQFFLVLNLLIFGVLTVITALRYESRGQGFVDGSLLFGAPLVGFGMQYAMTRHWEFGPAFSALGFSALYLPLAYWIFKRWPNEGRRLAASFVALGGGFATLAIPLALSAKWTAMAWTLEGLGIVWAGLSQGYRRMSWSGSALLLLAFVSALIAYAEGVDDLTFILVFATLALTWLCAGWLWSHHQDKHQEGSVPAQVQSMALWAGGLFAWVWGVTEGAYRWFEASRWGELLHRMSVDVSRWGDGLDYFPMGDSLVAALMLIGIAVSACIWHIVGSRKQWKLLQYSAGFLWPFAAGVLLFQIVFLWSHNPWQMGWWSLSWVAAIAAALWLLWREESGGLPARLKSGMHISLFWGVLVLVGCEVVWRIDQLPWGSGEWGVAIALISACGVIGLVRLADVRRLWPFTHHRSDYWMWGLQPLLPLMAVILFFANVMDGRMLNWTYMPLINPLEESALFALLTIAAWYRHAVSVGRLRFSGIKELRTLFFAAMLIWWTNGALLRALAFYGDLPWDFADLWESRLVQTVFALVWTLLSLICMVMATRRANRFLWSCGAVLLGVVILKLFIVDSAHGGGLARAVSFLGVAILVLLIGYYAPLPPRQKKAVEAALPTPPSTITPPQA